METRIYMTNQERNRLIAFLGTLTGTDIYVNEKWSDPFDENGLLTILNSPITSTKEIENLEATFYPNPTNGDLNISIEITNFTVEIYGPQGKHLKLVKSENNEITLSFNWLSNGIYLVLIKDENGNIVVTRKILKTTQ